MADTHKVGYGIVGCGSIARFHFGGLQEAGARVVHIADISEAAARQYVERTGARFSTNYKELIADPEVTVVSVLTSARHHLAISREALAAGKDVICEKTMTNNRAEAALIRDAARSSGRLFFTAFMKRFFPATRMARELLPRLGRIYSAQVRAYQNWGDDFQSMTDASKYSGILENYGGAVLKCAGSHMLDMTMFLLGKPLSVLANVDYVPNSRFDRRATALIEFPDGAVASFETAIHSLGKIGLERNSWEEWIELTGTKGRLKLSTVMWDHPLNNGLTLEHYDEATGAVTEHRFAPVNPFNVEMAVFHAALTKREKIAPDENDGYAVDSLIEAIETAAREGRRVSLDFSA